MDLLTNAVESIQIGVEDYGVASRPRLLSAVRNIHAGVLLLYKEALLRRSPAGSNEALIKSRVKLVPDAKGSIAVVGIGVKTVDTHQILERFKDLGIITDTKLLAKITSVRNEVEHYYPKITQDALRGVIASAFLIIRDFAPRELGEQPRDLLGQDTWNAMLTANELYQVERADCDSALGQVSWESDALGSGIGKIRCRECGSDLLQPLDVMTAPTDVVLSCRACGAEVDAEEFVPAAIEEALSWDAYVAVKDGGDEPYGTCPSCGIEAYVLGEGSCAYCGETADCECARCGQAIPLSEMGSAPLCGYCDHVMSKDD